MAIVLPRLKLGQTGTQKHLNAVIADIETAINAFAGALPITEANVTNLVADLAAKAPLASPVFTGTVTTPATVGTVQALAAAGAVDLVTRITTVAAAGAIALTLADGANGQLKTISMIAHVGDATLTPANFAGGATIKFTAAGQSVELVFVGGKWAIVSNNGATIA